MIRVGRMTERRDNFERYENVSLRSLLSRTNLPPDTVIEADDTTDVTIVDIDTHHWSSPPGLDELNAHLAAIMPTPDAAWTSHGRGLKLVFIGPYHADRALAAAFSVPRSFTVELLRRTRHPRATSSAHQGADCGAVELATTEPNAAYSFSLVGQLTPEQRAEALVQLNMESGRRYDHDRCPIDSGVDSNATACVVVLDRGVFCHRCAGHGVKYRDHLVPGFFPFAATIDDATCELDELASNLVHWTHAKIVLKHLHPNLAEAILERGYRRMLESRWGAGDPRINSVFNRFLDFIWGENMWLDSRNFTPTVVDNDAASGLPNIQWLKNKKGTTKVHINLVRRAQVKHRTPSGYRPVRPVIGISFANDDGSIPIIVPPGPRFPIELLGDPLAEENAFEILERSFPRLDRRYLKACLAAAICADARQGRPPMLACTGPSGSGKEQTICLAASCLGDQVLKLALPDDEEKLWRQIGAAITSGHRFLMFDELGKTQNLSSKIKAILEISSMIHWRALYQNRTVATPARAAFFYPCVRFPDFLTASAEFNRRTRRAHLHHKVPNWAETCGGDTALWRDRSAENARVANSLLTSVWRLCHELNFQFDS
jgi:hypothetical protein